MKKTFAKATLGLTSTAFLATIGAQAVHADSYVVQQGDSFFAIASANGMNPYELAANNGKTIFDTINPGDVLQVNGTALAQTYNPYSAPAYEAELADWLTMIQTNIIGLTYLTRKILPQMVERNDGYIINLGSTAGTVPYPGANVYGASKAFVKQFSLNLRADLAGKKIRVSNIEPGLCEGTEFSSIRFKGDEKRVEALYRDAHAIQPEDIANTVAWLIQQPKHVNVNRIEIMPVSQTFGPQPVYRGD